MPLRTSVDRAGPRVVVRLSGDCDLSTAPALQEVLAPLRPPDVTHLTLDTSGLEFLDSTGLGIVVGALKHLREGGGDLEIAGASGTVRRVLQVTGLDRVVRVS